MIAQLALTIQLRDDATFANFYPGKNQQLLTCLQDFIAHKGDQFVYFWGATGTGRTHLLHACCHTLQAQGEQATYLPLDQLKAMSPSLLENLESLALVCIDDVQVIVGHSSWEEALFHLYNRMYAENKLLLITGNAPPSALGLHLNDLASRFTWNGALQMTALSDQEKLIVLQSRAAARGFPLPEDVGQFLLRRCSRDMTTLFTVLEKLDLASLTAQRKITIPFVKAVLGF